MTKKQFPSIAYRLNYAKKLLLIMKFTTVLVFLTTLKIAATGYSQDAALRLDFQKGTLADLIQAIETQSDFRIFYKTDQVDVHKDLLLTSTDGTVASVLNDALEECNITYQVLDRLIVLTTNDMNFQDFQVKGRVTDASTGEALQGVNILIEGTNQGVVTDANGAYTVSVASTSAVLVFSYIGYITERIEIAGKTLIDVALVQDIQSLEEVIVIGYGTRAKKDITTSISTVSSKEISKIVNTSAEYSMMGRMAGVQVSGATGDPLSRPTVRIRGVNTWGVADPLYVIDGIAVTETGAGADAQADPRFGTLRGNINIMTLIDPNDIESISVLKDASAAAIYGVRAANGVVLITTKQGTKGDKPTIEFNARYGTQIIPRTFDMMTTSELVKFKQDAYRANLTIGEDQTKWNELNPAAPNFVGPDAANVDWQKAVINKNAPTQEYNVRMAGGTQRSAYSISGGYANNEGVLVGTNLERYSIATNMQSDINDWFRIGLNQRMAYIKGRDNEVEGFNLRTISQLPPWQPIYEEDGYLGYASSVRVNPDGITGTTGRWSSDPKSNPLGILATQEDTYGQLRTMGNAFVEFEPLKGFKVKASVSADYFNRATENFIDYDGWMFTYGNDKSKVLTYPNSVGALSNTTAENINIIKELSVTYARNIGDHHIDLLFNAMDQQYRFHSNLVKGFSMTTKDKGPRFIGNMEDRNTNVQTDVMRNALQGYMGRVSYNYKSRYYLDITLRRDGSSKFAKEQRWGTFPGLSAAWRISDESFMPEAAWITDIRLRAAWGSLGNMEVRDLAWAYIINPNPAYSWGYSTDGQGIYGAGAAIPAMANPDLSWEKTTTSNLGMDFTLFRGSLTGSFEYYNKLTDGIIQQIGLPPSIGYKETPFVNLAQVRNKGIEIMFSYNGNFGDLSYNVGGNLTTVKNIVEKTYKDLRYTTSAGLVEEGYSIGYERGYVFGGIYQSQPEADEREAAVADNSRKQLVVPGDAWFKDINGPPSEGYKYETPGADNKVDVNDQTFLWNNIAPYYYGLNFGLGYKGIDFSTLWTGVGGLYGHWDGLTGMGSKSNNTLRSANDAWTVDNPSSWLPRNVYGDPNNNMRKSDRDKQSRSYLRMQSIQIGYTLPRSVYNKLGNALSNLRVYASGNNIWTISPWPGINPDGAEEMPYVLNLGLSARF